MGRPQHGVPCDMCHDVDDILEAAAKNAEDLIASRAKIAKYKKALEHIRDTTEPGTCAWTAWRALKDE